MSSGRGACALALVGPDVAQVQYWFQEPGSVVVTVGGELDHLGAELLQSVMGQAWDRWPDEVTVDLTGVVFINARGLACLLQANRTARTRKLRLRLRCRPGLVARMLLLVGLGGQLQMDTRVNLDDPGLFPPAALAHCC